MDLKNKIFILDQVLTPEECEEAIAIFKNSKEANRPEMEIFRDTQLLQINANFPSLTQLAQKIKNSAEFISNQIEIDWCQVVEWVSGSKQQYHKDDASGETVFTSITYLNAEYFGGQTQFYRDIGIVPKIGRTVYFDGNHYIHGVTPVENGTRYTLPIWYKTMN